MPSFPNSPWIRGAPHNGFAVVIVRTSARMVDFVVGRPWRRRCESRVQRRRSHWRCHRTTVSGCTMIKAERQSRQPLGEENPKQSVRRSKLRTFHRSRQHGQLLTEREVLQHDGSVPAADHSDRSEECHQRRQHA